MKITGVDLLVTRVSEHEDWRPAAIRPLPGGMRPTRCDDYVVVTIHTDEGIDGHAFGMGAKEGLRSAEAIKTVFVPELIGENPLDHEYLLQKLMRADRYSGHVPITAHGPIDVALWDITAKKAGLPLWRLLGGYRDRVPAYATSPRYDTIDEYVQGALRARERGFQAFKLHTPGTVEGDIESCRAVREAMGPDFVLMSDPVAPFDHMEAMTVGRELEKLGFLWYEEPIHDYDMYGYKQLADALDIAVAACEWNAGKYFTAAQFIQARAADIIRSDPSWKGGFTGFLKTAHLCEAYGMNCEVHAGCTPLMDVANLHAACAIKNCRYLKLSIEEDSFGLMAGVSPDEDGLVTAPTDLGLGVELEWDTLRSSAVAEL